MKAITGNDLKSGLVVYLGSNNQWTDTLSEARLIDEAHAETVLAEAKLRVREISDAYLIDVTDNAHASGRKALHETIRSMGPTVRLDLGKQAEQTLEAV